MHYLGYDRYLSHWLFRIVRGVVMRRADGRCEKCGEKATEVHHLTYPEWGSFDTPTNMIAVCHACHCLIENKEK